MPIINAFVLKTLASSIGINLEDKTARDVVSVMNKAADGGQEIIEQVKKLSSKGLPTSQLQEELQNLLDDLLGKKPAASTPTQASIPKADPVVNIVKEPTVSTPEEHVSSAKSEKEFLDTYDASVFERPSLTVDLAIFTVRNGQLMALLIERGDYPFKGSLALPGGFANSSEDADTAARRELAEETGLEFFPGHLEQLKTYTTPGRDPRTWVVSVAHVAIAPDLGDPKAGSDAATARWIPVEEVLEAIESSKDALAFDHAEIFIDALERVRAKLEYSSLATSFLPKEFTLGELRQVYTAVWGSAPNLNAFRRKALATPGFVLKVDRVDPSTGKEIKKSGDMGAPGTLYRAGAAVELYPPFRRTSIDGD